ncbi:MAG: hypothetical protein IJ512_01130 [Ruminococcus sp.]|nr:hypothetical protein [Ruminococcus sp.]
MAGYTRRDGSAMRRDAAARASQMQQRVPYKKSAAEYIEKPGTHEEAYQETVPKKEPSVRTQDGMQNIVSGLTGGIDRLLTQMDTDRMLILALLVMLYKDGSNKKLMMALAYLLT